MTTAFRLRRPCRLVLTIAFVSCPGSLKEIRCWAEPWRHGAIRTKRPNHERINEGSPRTNLRSGWGWLAERYSAWVMMLLLICSVLPILRTVGSPTHWDVLLYRIVGESLSEMVVPYRDRPLEFPPHAIPFFSGRSWFFARSRLPVRCTIGDLLTH